jgi:predicted acetyltransferase
MTPDLEYGTITDSTDATQLGKLLSQCFISPANREELYLQRIGLKNFRVVRRQGKMVGGLSIIPMGQWWQGQLVSMGGIASVGIAPEERGSGVAIALIHTMLQELYDQGTAISVLYPATQQLYRKAGYEQGGHYCGWEIDPRTIHLKERSLPIEPIDLNHAAILQMLYRQQAQQTNGNLDRHSCLWQEIIHSDSHESIHAYVFGTPDQPQGYLIFSQERTPSGSILKIKDWVALTPTAAKSLWSFLSSHRSQIDKVLWWGGAIAALPLLLPEQTAKLRSTQRWMLRLVDVAKALENRGYAPDSQAELHLDIHDPLLPNNNRKWVLTVAKGHGQVTPGGKGELKTSVSGLAPLYTGLFTPYELQQLGQIDGTTSALTTARHLFAGASPWMPDFF